MLRLRTILTFTRSSRGQSRKERKGEKARPRALPSFHSVSIRAPQTLMQQHSASRGNGIIWNIPKGSKGTSIFHKSCSTSSFNLYGSRFPSFRARTNAVLPSFPVLLSAKTDPGRSDPRLYARCIFSPRSPPLRCAGRLDVGLGNISPLLPFCLSTRLPTVSCLHRAPGSPR